ncbi:hypothetical protein BJ741DRAFT_603248 [Chytriomyces cf. hyalinus JEL632]|nr:hypothetical protein BJ741DRAFT_603248 [Chytriomyces cf. hyalinus JEL632]
MSAAGVIFRFYHNATDLACNSAVVRMDYSLTETCTANASANALTTTKCRANEETTDSARHSTGCVAPSNLPSVYLTSLALPLVLFKQFADSDTACTGSALVGGTQYPVDSCVQAHTETGFHTENGRKVQSEYLSANASTGQLVRSFYSDDQCYNHIRSVPLDEKLEACQEHMSATIINPLIFERTITYLDDACTQPGTIDYDISNFVSCVDTTDCKKTEQGRQEISCLNQPSLGDDAASLFKSKPYGVLDYHQDKNCAGLIGSLALLLNVCQPTAGRKSHNFTALPDGSFVGTFYKAPNCIGESTVGRFSQNGACSGFTRLTVFNSPFNLGGMAGTDAVAGSSGNSSTTNLNLAPIVGGIGGAVVVLGVVAAVFYFREKKKRDATMNLRSSDTPDTSGTSASPPPGRSKQLPLVLGGPSEFAVARDPSSSPTSKFPTVYTPATTDVIYQATSVSSSDSDAARETYAASSSAVTSRPDPEKLLSREGPPLPVKSAAENERTSFVNALAPTTHISHPTALFQPIHIGEKVTLPMDPATRTVAEVALWIFAYGGTSLSAQISKEHEVDGRSLMRVNTVELLQVFKITKIGQKLRFEEGLEELKMRSAVYGAGGKDRSPGPPPAYN